MKKIFLLLAILGTMSFNSQAQKFIMKDSKDAIWLREMPPKMTEFYSPEVPVVTPGNYDCGTAPSDAIVLFDGKDLSAWCGEHGEDAGWIVNNDGTFTVNKKFGHLYTREKFGSCQIHLEWSVPEGVHGTGQGRGNSGIYIQTKYEVQILDNYENETYVNGKAGAIYKQNAPLANALRAPGKWNVYDIIYTAPTFKKDGTFKTYPYVTVLVNGVLVQQNTMILGSTEYTGLPTVQAHGDMPFLLQSHPDPSEPISFRNVWVRKLE